MLKKNFISYVVLALLFLMNTSVFAEASCIDLQRSLAIGAKDGQQVKDVTALQNFLIKGGFLTGESTGYFGMMTWKGVTQFQKINSISPTGTVGPLTRSKIKVVSCGAPSISGSGNGGIEVTSGASNNSIVMTIDTKGTAAEKSSAVAPFQVIVDGSIQIDASQVSKEVGDEMCRKSATSNVNSVIKCVWDGKQIGGYASGVVVPVPQPTALPVPQPVVSTSATPTPTVPFALLKAGPTSVPYGGGYDYFQFTSFGMKGCTLYFKEGGNSSWNTGGSIGTSYSLPGYKGMTTSRSYYASCLDNNGQKFDSNIVTITVAKQ